MGATRRSPTKPITRIYLKILYIHRLQRDSSNPVEFTSLSVRQVYSPVCLSYSYKTRELTRPPEATRRSPQPGFSASSPDKGNDYSSTSGSDRECGTVSHGTATHSTDGSDLSLSEQPPIGATVTVALDGRSPTEIWAELSSSEAFQGELVKAALDAGQERTYLEYHDLLEDAEIDALHGSIRSLILGVAQGHESALWSFLREIREFGNGSEIDGTLDVSRLFALGLENRPDRDVPTFAFTVKREFREQKANQRRAICEIIGELARGSNVHIAGDRDTQKWLVDTHRDELGVSSGFDTTPTCGPMSELVDKAIGELNPDGREAKILRTLSDESTGALSYHSLYSVFHVENSRVRQCIIRLEDLGMVNTYGPPNSKMVQLLEAGREYLSQTTRQTTLEDTPPKTSPKDTCTTPIGTEGEEDSRLYQTAVDGWSNKETASAISLDNDVAIVPEPVGLDQSEQERKTKRVYYDRDRDVATVSVRAAGPAQLLCSTASALTKPWLLKRTLPDSRIEEIDEPPMFLREARNIGWLPDESLENPSQLRKVLIERGEEIEGLTTKLHHADPDEKGSLAATIMRQSMGLAGATVHLLDAAGIDVVREIRLAGGLSLDQLDNLAECLTRSILIQSKYGVFSPYRHFVETDAGTPLLSPEVDATDATGELIGSYVIRGRDAHRLRRPLETALASPGEFLDDPPAFSIPVTVREVGRTEYATAATRVLKSKNLKPTREAVDLVRSFTGSPYDAAKCLNQLKKEDTARDIRPDEIRYALSTLEADRILPDLPPTVGAVVYELLQATESISQAEIADRAGVSTQSIRNNREYLEALSLVTIERGAWRLNLSFSTTAERRSSPVVPALVDSEFIDAVDALLETVLSPEEYADPDGIGGALYWPPDPWRLLDYPDLEQWVRLAARLTGTEQPDNETSISVGPAIQQTAITETGATV